MIGIDLRFISDDEIKAGRLLGSYSNVISDILDVFAKSGISDGFSLIVYKKQEDLVTGRFPHFKITVLNALTLRILQRLTGHNMTGYISRVKIWQSPLKDIDMIWYPITAPGQVMSKKIPYCCIVHDLIAIHNYDDSRQRSKYLNMLAGAYKIFTISGYVKCDISATFPEVDAERVYVIHDPVSYNPAETLEPIMGIKRSYILDINGYGIHKNPMTLLKAYELIKNQAYSDIDLVFCGAWKHDDCYDELAEYIKKRNLKDSVHLLYQVTLEQRNWLLKNAELFVTPSLDEGFGMTPIEAAMRCIPVISTKETSLYEVTMGLLNYVNNAKDENELALLMRKILKEKQTPGYMSHLQKVAHILSREYKPEKVAGRYYELLLKE